MGSWESGYLKGGEGRKELGDKTSLRVPCYIGSLWNRVNILHI